MTSTISTSCQSSSKAGGKRRVVAVDIDDVLAHYIEPLLRYHRVHSGISVDIEELTYFGIFPKLFGGPNADMQVFDQRMKQFYESSIFEDEIEPNQLAQRILKKFHTQLNYEFHAVTARPSYISAQTEKWLRQHYPNVFKQIHYCHTEEGYRSKSVICKEIEAICLIDDSPNNVKDLIVNNIPAILFGNYPWNRILDDDMDGFDRNKFRKAKDWEDVHDYLAGSHFLHAEMNPEDVGIAVIQMCSTNDKMLNWMKCSNLIRRAVTCTHGNIDLVCVPECFGFIGTSSQETLEHAEIVMSADPSQTYLSSPLLNSYCALAKELNVWISLGGLQCRCSQSGFYFTSEEDIGQNKIDKIANVHFIISSDGKVKTEHCYQKIHLFDAPVVSLKESSSTVAGNKLVIVDIGKAKIGLTTCFDLRFPRMFSTLKQLGADIILVPSAFTVPTGEAHWEVLLRARAIENQVMIVAAAQVGKHNEKRVSYGHSLVADAWGKIDAICREEIESFCLVVFSKANQMMIRDKINIQDYCNYDNFDIK